MRALVLAVVTAACFRPTFKVDVHCDAEHRCPTGYVCVNHGLEDGPQILVCLVDPPAGLCGDGIVQQTLGEQCDQGIDNGVGSCSPLCQLEFCGNGVIDPGELCDNGSGSQGNGTCHGCTLDCKSLEQCGDGIVNPECGEVCDQGSSSATIDTCVPPNAAGERCGENCRSTELCGNGIVDVQCGELCDPPGPLCSDDCHSALVCGNGIVDPGEECDDGAANCDNCDCRPDCVINRCGDGFADTLGSDHHEDCDAAVPVVAGDRHATPTESASCNLDCTTAVCGDGKVNGHAGEECDGNNPSCNSSCKLTACP